MRAEGSSKGIAGKLVLVLGIAALLGLAAACGGEPEDGELSSDELSPDEIGRTEQASTTCDSTCAWFLLKGIPFCGDNTCNGSETQSNCPDDCCPPGYGCIQQPLPTYNTFGCYSGCSMKYLNGMYHLVNTCYGAASDNNWRTAYWAWIYFSCWGHSPVAVVAM